MKNKKTIIITIIFFCLYLLITIAIAKLNIIKIQKINNEIISSSKETIIKHFSNNNKYIEYPSHKNGDLNGINTSTSNDSLIKLINKCLDPYTSLKKARLIDVDINKLKKVNSNTVGWIQIRDTDISYPFVQYKDDKYYSNHSYYKTKNSVGWPFMYSKSSSDFSDKNTVIYAIGDMYRTKFESIRNLAFSDWMEKDESHIIKIATEDESLLWQVVSVYTKPIKTNTSPISFKGKQFKKFKNKILKDSIYDFKADIDNDDKILTLIIRYNKYHNVYVHAKLIKRLEK